MAFKNDGSTHESGVKAEHNFIGRIFDAEHEQFLSHGEDLFPDLLGKSCIVEHKGGPNNKADCIIKDADGNKVKDVSNKKKEKVPVGSWDWANSSSIITENPEWFADALSAAETHRKSVESNIGVARREIDNNKSKAKTEVNKACNKNLREMTSDRIKHVLRETVINKNQDITVVVSDLENSVDSSWSFMEHPLLDVIDTHTATLEGKFLNNDNITSARIVFVKGDERRDEGLRMRITTNNGFGALVGDPNSTNKDSKIVVKIQQDKCDTLLERVQKKGNLIAKSF